ALEWFKDASSKTRVNSNRTVEGLTGEKKNGPGFFASKRKGGDLFHQFLFPLRKRYRHQRMLLYHLLQTLCLQELDLQEFPFGACAHGMSPPSCRRARASS